MVPVQGTAVLGALAVLAWSVPGLIVNPDFLVALPVLASAARPAWAAITSAAAAGSLIATGIWALASTQVAGGLFYFPHNGGDALLHFATAAIFLAGVAHYALTRRARVVQQGA